MHHPSRTLFVLAFLAAFVGITTLAPTSAPLAYAIDGGGGGSEGGGGGGGDTGSTGGGRGGSHRGHNTHATYHVISWLAYQYGLTNRPQGAYGGSSQNVLSYEEKLFICSIQRYLKRLGATVRPDIVAYTTITMQRPADVVESALRNPSLCD